MKVRITAKDILSALLSGVLITLPFLYFSMAQLIWIALIPLLWASRGKNIRQGVALGLLAGLIFGCGSIHWLSRVTQLGYLLLGFYLAIYWAGWNGLVAWVASRRPGWVWWSAPAFFTALEFLRSHLFTGFPWNLLGVSQARNLPLIQVASFTGVYGVSFLIVLFNTAAALLLLTLFHPKVARRRGFRLWIAPAAAIGLLIAALFYGSGELKRARPAAGGDSPFALCLVQGGIAQGLKWDPALAGSHFRTYLRLSREALNSRPDLIVWPESAVPYYIEEEPVVRGALGDLARTGRTCLLIGGDCRTEAKPFRYYNSAYLFEADGTLQGRYDKAHLVPYGEYTPLKRFLPFLKRVVPWEDDFSAGEEVSPFDLGKDPRGRGLKVGVLICYEDIFPSDVRTVVRRGANLLANVTNDAWYGRTAAPFQHADAALFRAVENRIYLGRSTNTGYSCVIDPWGRVVGEVVDEKGSALFVSGWKTVDIYPGRPNSFYLKYGDIFSWICVGLSLGAVLGCIHKRR